MAKRKNIQVPGVGHDLILQIIKFASRRRLSWRTPLKRFCLEGDESELKTEIPLVEQLGEFAELDIFLPKFRDFDDYHRRLVVFLLAHGHVGDLERWLKKYLPGEQQDEDYYGLIVESLGSAGKEIDHDHLNAYAIRELCCFRKDGQPNSVGRHLQKASASSLQNAFSKTGIGSSQDRVLQKNYEALMKLAPQQVAKALVAMFKIKKKRSFVEDFLWFYLPVNPGPLLPFAKKVVADMTYPYHKHMYTQRIGRCEKIALKLAKQREKAAIRASKDYTHRANG